MWRAELVPALAPRGDQTHVQAGVHRGLATAARAPVLDPRVPAHGLFHLQHLFHYGVPRTKYNS